MRPASDHISALPWERSEEDSPSGIGICLSGGGVRAAMFGLGVLQALQRERGLLFGPDSAEHLACVSGGSYVAATFALNAAALAGHTPPRVGAPPLAPNSPEERYVLGHGRYLVENGAVRTGLRLAVPGLLNIVALLGLFLWTGTMLADVAWIAANYGPAWLQPPSVTSLGSSGRSRLSPCSPAAPSCGGCTRTVASFALSFRRSEPLCCSGRAHP
jgi:Lysophospholipase catalytic domain